MLGTSRDNVDSSTLHTRASSPRRPEESQPSRRRGTTLLLLRSAGVEASSYSELTLEPCLALAATGQQHCWVAGDGAAQYCSASEAGRSRFHASLPRRGTSPPGLVAGLSLIARSDGGTFIAIACTGAEQGRAALAAS